MFDLDRFLFHGATGIAVILGLCVLPGVSLAQQANPGKADYVRYCASCHGTTGKGDGPVANLLVVKPTDLTLLAKQNNGTFPALRVERAIDGRDSIKGHGDSEMPVWGERMKRASNPGNPRETTIRCRICQVVGYIKSIQEK